MRIAEVRTRLRRPTRRTNSRPRPLPAAEPRRDQTRFDGRPVMPSDVIGGHLVETEKLCGRCGKHCVPAQCHCPKCGSALPDATPVSMAPGSTIGTNADADWTGDLQLSSYDGYVDYAYP